MLNNYKVVSHLSCDLLLVSESITLIFATLEKKSHQPSSVSQTLSLLLSSLSPFLGLEERGSRTLLGVLGLAGGQSSQSGPPVLGLGW